MTSTRLTGTSVPMHIQHLIPSQDYLSFTRGCQQRWEASTEQAIAKLSRFEQKRLREIKSAAEAERCLQKLFGTRLCTTDYEAVVVIQLAMANVMSFLDLSLTSLELRLDTTVVWGFFGLIFTVNSI